MNADRPRLPRDREASPDAVVLVHGLWMTGFDLFLLWRRLHHCGFTVHRFHYASTRLHLADSAARLQRFVTALPAETVHFVGHSLGGLVIRRLFLDFPEQPPGRIVTLGTPHQSSKTAAMIGNGRLGRILLGRSNQALTEQLPPWGAPRQLGVIAGTRPFGLGRLFLSHPGPNDGTVAVEEAVLPGSTDQLILAVSHTGMIFSPVVAQQVCHFLHHGRFEHRH